ncbi:MAG: hypothetical protein ACK5LP_04950 [Campylobacteraceae bacterium]
MALPLFLAGVVAGGAAILALNNKDKIIDEAKKTFKKVKSCTKESADKVENFAETGLEKTKEVAAKTLRKTSELALKGEKKLQEKKPVKPAVKKNITRKKDATNN